MALLYVHECVCSYVLRLFAYLRRKKERNYQHYIDMYQGIRLKPVPVFHTNIL